MKLKKCYILMPVLVIALTSCGKRGVEHKIEEYFNNNDCPTLYNETKGFNILQLSDTHIGNMCDRSLQYKFMQKTVDLSKKYLKDKNIAEKPDFIIVTGDLFTFGTREIAKEYFAFLDKQEIPWTVCFGNHDEQAYYSIDWLTGYLNELNQKRINSINKNKLESYCIFNDLQDDNVFGNSNFVINVKDKNGKVVENLYVLDSNRYNFKFNGYDYIHQDQIDWFDKSVEYAKTLNNDNTAPQGLAFFHIPVPEFNNAVTSDGKIKEGWEFVKDIEDGRELSVTGEPAVSPKEDLGFYKHLCDSKIIRGCFVGHDHVNGWAAKSKDENINMTFSFAVKSTDTVNYQKQSLGGQLIMLNKNYGTEDYKKNNFSIHQILHTYEKIDEEVK